jgi:uncharacterized protein DUF4381
MSAANGPDLRDIHLPPAPSWWPPAPGWWIAAIVLLAAIAFGIFVLVREWRERQWRRRVAAELDRIAATHAAQPVLLAAEVSQLLRRASLLIEPGAAALEGDAWLAFLDRQVEGGAATKPAVRFQSDAGRALLDAPYRRADDPLAKVDANALVGLARSWLKRALPRGRRRV